MIFNEVVVLISTIEVSRFLITYSSFTCDSAAVCPSQSRSSGGHSYCSSSSFGKQLDLSSSANLDRHMEKCERSMGLVQIEKQHESEKDALE